MSKSNFLYCLHEKMLLIQVYVYAINLYNQLKITNFNKQITKSDKHFIFS